jgi:hypothetical protein
MADEDGGGALSRIALTPDGFGSGGGRSADHAGFFRGIFGRAAGGSSAFVVTPSTGIPFTGLQALQYFVFGPVG